MVAIKVSQTKIGGRVYQQDKTNFPYMPTIMSGVDIQWGAPSCIEHPEASRAQISLWVPKTYEDWIPSLGEIVNIKGGPVLSGITQAFGLFNGKVESVKIQDDHEPYPTPLTTVRNLITNPSFEEGLQGWTTGANWTASTTTDYFAGSKYSMVVTRANTTAGNGSVSIPFQQVSGTTYRASFAVLGAPSGPYTSYTMKAGNSAATTFSVTNAWATKTFTWTANTTGTVNLTISDDNNATPTVGSKIYIDTVMVADTGASTTYFSGDSASTSTKINSWDGTPRLSTSTQKTFAVGYPKAGYRVNIVASDALAEASRLRLSDSPWPFEQVLNRQVRIANLASSKGVAFAAGLSAEQGYSESLGTYVTPRDVDSAPALEVFQRTTMAAGHTVISVDNQVMPASTPKLPSILTPTTTGATSIASWLGTTHSSRSVLKTNGVVTRTNFASNPSGETNSNGFSAVPGSGGVAVVTRTGWAKYGVASAGIRWDTAAPNGSTPAVEYTETAMAGTSGSKLSMDFWVYTNTTNTYQDYKTVVTLLNGATVVTTVNGPTVRANNGMWGEVRIEGITATGAYDTVKISVQPQTYYPGLNVVDTGQTIVVDALIIEKTASIGHYFDGNTITGEGTSTISERFNVAHFDISQVQDENFEIDTSKVINEVKVEMKRIVGSAGTPGVEDNDQIFNDPVASKKTTPQTRSLSTDWAIQDAYMTNDLPTSTMVLKGKLLLSAQSKAQWRMSGPVVPVLSTLPESVFLTDVMDEDTRFGSLIKIDNGPTLLPSYFRIHAGRMVFGDDQYLAFEVEPVEYSAPIPLTPNTLRGDSTAALAAIGSFKTISSNDLRAVGAR